MYNRYGFFGQDLNIDYCEKPKRQQIMNLSNNELKEIPLETQIQMLKEQVDELGNALVHCISILNTFQQTSFDYIHYMEGDIRHIENKLIAHSEKAHAMLIVGNKEVKDESNIPRC